MESADQRAEYDKGFKNSKENLFYLHSYLGFLFSYIFLVKKKIIKIYNWICIPTYTLSLNNISYTSY